MKRYPQITLVTVRCSCCNENAPHDKDHAVCQYAPATEMVVCPNCQEDYVNNCKVYGTAVVFVDLPSEKIDFETLDMDEDD